MIPSSPWNSCSRRQAKSRMDSRRAGYPSVMEYCRAVMGSFSKISAEMAAISLIGKASAAGFPAAKGMMEGSEVAFKISRMAEGCREAIRSEI